MLTHNSITNIFKLDSLLILYGYLFENFLFFIFAFFFEAGSMLLDDSLAMIKAYQKVLYEQSINMRIAQAVKVCVCVFFTPYFRDLLFIVYTIV